MHERLDLAKELQQSIKLPPAGRPVEALFIDRVPEAAARQLSTVLAWLAECQLATLEGLQCRKSTSKSELARQTDICDYATQHCYELRVEPRGMCGVRCVRLAARLDALAR